MNNNDRSSNINSSEVNLTNQMDIDASSLSTDMDIKSDSDDEDYVPGSGSSNFTINSDASATDTVIVQKKRKTPGYTKEQLYAAIAFKIAMPNATYSEIKKLFGPIPRTTIDTKIKRNAAQIQKAAESIISEPNRRKTNAAKHAVLSDIRNKNVVKRLEKEFDQSAKNHRNKIRANKEYFTVEEESKLEKWLVEMSKVALAVSKQSFLDLVTKCLAEKNQINCENVKIGKCWFNRFMKRCTLIKMVKSNIYELKRAKSLSKGVLECFAEVLGDLCTQLNITDPQQIIAFDETGFSGAIEGNKYNIHAVKNLKTEWGKNVIASGEIPDHISLLHICDAAGNVYPPYYVFAGPPNKIVVEFSVDELGGAYFTSAKGSFLGEHFQIIIEFINSHNKNKLLYRSDTSKPLIILCDGAPQHLNLRMLEKARELNMHIITLPSNTTHITQLQDRFIFNKLKQKFKEEARKEFIQTHAKFTEYSFIKIINRIWTTVCNSEKIKSGFKKLGYFPFSKNLILEKANSDAVKPAEMFEENKMLVDEKSSESATAVNVLSQLNRSDLIYNYKENISIIDLNNLKSLAISTQAAIRNVESAYEFFSNNNIQIDSNDNSNNNNNSSPSNEEMKELCRSTSNELKTLLRSKILTPEKPANPIPNTLEEMLTIPTFQATGKPARSIRKLTQTNAILLTSDETFKQLQQAHLERNKLHCQRIKKYLNEAAGVVLNHRLHPLYSHRKNKTDIADELGHIFDDEHEAKLIEYHAGIIDLPTAHEAAITSRELQVIRNQTKLFPKFTRSKLEPLINRSPMQDRSYVYHGGILANGLQQQQIGDLLQVDFHNNQAIGPQMNASSLFVFNQSITCCGGHFDGLDGWLWLKSGLKLWLTVPTDSAVEKTISSWRLIDLLKVNERKWFLQYPGDLVIAPASTKHIVISLKPSIAFSSFFNSMLGTIDSVDWWLEVRARNQQDDELQILEEYGIDSACIDAIIDSLTQSLSNLLKELGHRRNNTRDAIRDLYNRRKNIINKHLRDSSNDSMRDRVKQLSKLLAKM